MPKSLVITLPVADVAASTRFYEAIGMVEDDRFAGPQSAAMIWSDTITVMLAHHDLYRTLTPKRIADPRTDSQALFALPMDSREQVDAITAAAIAAGGREAHGAQDEGFMYSRGFEDPDGHGFGPFHLDMAAAAAAQAA